MGEPTGEDRPLTVAELIDLLRRFPPSLPVWTEGCDCLGPAAGVELEPDKRSLLITRTP
jgi:hypothetical protein